MKYRLLILLILLSGGIIQAQIRKIPAEVTEAFKVRYPHAEKVEWKDKVSSFQAGFLLNGYKMSADFSSKGEWERTERVITFNDLPGEVIDGFKKSKYADWTTGSVAEIDVNDEGIKYRIFVKKSDISKKYLFFDTHGRLLKENSTL